MTNVLRGPRKWFMASPERPTVVIERTAARLRATRCALGLTQRRMAELCNVTEARWSNWERGDHFPDILVMMQLSNLFGVTLDWLYRGALSGMPHRLAAELQRRRPDLVLGGDPHAAPAPDWDQIGDPADIA
jgi:transcriptional regulator with XRE-family HTH domain